MLEQRGNIMKKSLHRTMIFGCLFVLTGLFLSAPALAQRIDSGSVSGIWSCWYWDWVDDEDPSLFDDGDAMNRFDILVSDSTYTNYAQWWEYQYHGPPQNPDKWWGHCHAWAGAACWERQPSKYKVIKNAATGVKVKFRVRDRKGLMCEAYYNDASSSVADFMISQPSPGLMWYALRQEIKGINPMWGKKRGFVGELYYGDQVWNYPIYKYKVTCWWDPSSGYYGTMTIWGASDGNPKYADWTDLYSMKLTYQFSGVQFDAYGMPYDGGEWIGTGPQSRPDSIWRPQYPSTWATYLGNPYLYNEALDVILYKKQ